jgi:hypothetical protein
MASTTVRTSVTPGEVLAHIPESFGLLQPITKALQCTRSAVQKVLDENPEIAEKFADAEEDAKDTVIKMMIKDAKAGDAKARELFLKSRARDRGYGDKLEISGDKDKPLVFLHAAARDLVGNDPKPQRIDSWQSRAIDYHEKQTIEAESKDIDDLIPAKKGGRGKDAASAQKDEN